MVGWTHEYDTVPMAWSGIFLIIIIIISLFTGQDGVSCHYWYSTRISELFI